MITSALGGRAGAASGRPPEFWGVAPSHPPNFIAGLVTGLLIIRFDILAGAGPFGSPLGGGIHAHGPVAGKRQNRADDRLVSQPLGRLSRPRGRRRTSTALDASAGRAKSKRSSSTRRTPGSSRRRWPNASSVVRRSAFASIRSWPRRRWPRAPAIRPDGRLNHHAAGPPYRRPTATPGQFFMPQCGLAPGFISIVARHLADWFDELDTLRMRVSGAAAISDQRASLQPHLVDRRTDQRILQSVRSDPRRAADRSAAAGGAGTILPRRRPLRGLQHLRRAAARLCETLEGRVRELNYQHHSLCRPSRPEVSSATNCGWASAASMLKGCSKTPCRSRIRTWS